MKRAAFTAQLKTSAGRTAIFRQVSKLYKEADALEVKGGKDAARRLYEKADRLLARASKSGAHIEGPVGRLPNPQLKAGDVFLASDNSRSCRSCGKKIKRGTLLAVSGSRAPFDPYHLACYKREEARAEKELRERNPQFDYDDLDIEGEGFELGTKQARALGRGAREHREAVKRFEVSWYAPGRRRRVSGPRAIEALSKAAAIAEARARIRGREFRDFKGATNFLAREVNPFPTGRQFGRAAAFAGMMRDSKARVDAMAAESGKRSYLVRRAGVLTFTHTPQARDSRLYEAGPGRKNNPWACLECGKTFRSAAAAEKAAFGDEGCPRCGSSDVTTVSALLIDILVLKAWTS